MKRKGTVMESRLLTAIKTPTPPPNVAYNEKGALSYSTTESAVLDWFSSGGAMRKEEETKIQAVFAKAFTEDKLLALKVAFYIRDVRGGQGQRKSFRSVLKWLATQNSDTRRVLRNNLENIPVYGRWDDLWSLLGTRIQPDIVRLVNVQLNKDVKALRTKDASISLLAKWMPSANTSSKTTRAEAVILTQALGLSPKEYRKMLSKLRARINIVERAMCAKDWTSINYEHVPSNASMLYRKAFPKHDPVGYAKWKGKAFSGEAKVHASTLYPYDLIARCMRQGWDETLELQWRNLPDYFSGEIHNGLVVCDTSGSMHSWSDSTGVPGDGNVRPLDIAVSLAMYMAERMNGPFKNHFITFSQIPEMQQLIGNTIYEKSHNLSRANWSMNTNVQAVFDLILTKALENKLKQTDMPDAIYIVSDLQFDNCGFEQRNFDLIKTKFKKAGYKMPLLVFWQVRYNKDKVALKNEKGVAMVSGFSPAALTSILKLEQPREITPYELMLATVNTERYEAVRL